MRYILSVVLASIIMTAGAAYPHGKRAFPGEVSVEVVSDGGATLLAIPHKDIWKGGTRIIKQYLEAKKGERYSVVIRNSTPGRVGVVVAVDGRNIITGKKSDLKPSEDMYIVGGHETSRSHLRETGDDHQR